MPSRQDGVLPFTVRAGVDVTSVEEVARSIEVFGQRYLSRVFTPAEIESCRGERSPRAASLAARFAAKEATIKVLAPEDEATDLRTIEVRRRPSGACEIHLSGSAARLAERAGLGPFAVSLSHEGNVAVAIVLALCAVEP